jgi:hypothetical protein
MRYFLSRTVFVHVGPRKTATSTIQSVLRKHDNSVVIYPKVGLWRDGSHHGLIFSFFDDPRRRDNDFSALLEQLSAEVNRSDRNVLISSETLSVERDVGAFLRAVLPSIDSGEVKVEVLLACREHFNRAASLFNHHLRYGSKISPDNFLRKHASGLCYAPLLEELGKCDAKITALDYHQPDWIERFLVAVGFTTEQIPPIQSRLVAFSPKVTIAKMAINQFAQSERLNRKFTRAFKELPESRKASDFIFGHDAAIQAERAFSADRQLIAERFAITLAAPDLERERSRLFITPEEFLEIQSVVQSLGHEAREIARFAGQYVRG